MSTQSILRFCICLTFAAAVIVACQNQRTGLAKVLSGKVENLHRVMDSHDYWNPLTPSESNRIREASEHSDKIVNEGASQISDGQVLDGTSTILRGEIDYYRDGSYSEDVKDNARHFNGYRVWLLDWIAGAEWPSQLLTSMMTVSIWWIGLTTLALVLFPPSQTESILASLLVVSAGLLAVVFGPIGGLIISSSSGVFIQFIGMTLGFLVCLVGFAGFLIIQTGIAMHFSKHGLPAIETAESEATE